MSVRTFDLTEVKHSITDAQKKLESAIALHDFRVACSREAEAHRATCQRSISALKAQITMLNKQLEQAEQSLHAKQIELGSWQAVKPSLQGCSSWAIPSPMVEASTNGIGLPRSSGVYFVWPHKNSATCVYVGQSVCIGKRAVIGSAGQRSDGKIFAGDWVSWLPVSAADLDFAEAFYIGILRPARNHRAQPGHRAHSQAHS